jgi:prepilin-type processing-associated H-X9-DG protein
VLAYETGPFHGNGVNALFADGHVEVITIAQFRQLQADVAAGKVPPVVAGPPIPMHGATGE